MSESEKVITLPDAEEMRRRLVSVNDTSHMQESFYPILLKQAGQTKVAMGVVMMLSLAIHDYTERLPAIMSSMLYMQADEFVDALVDDVEVATEAKAHLKEVLGQTT